MSFISEDGGYEMCHPKTSNSAFVIHLRPGTTAQYICNSDALARKAADSLHLQQSRLKRLLSKVKELFR